MKSSSVYRPYAETTAHATCWPIEPTGAWSGLRGHRFELVSRGDFVPGRLHTPDEAGEDPHPLLLVGHDLRARGETAAPEWIAGWIRKGLAMASIDLPLHGARSSPKLSERLATGVERLARGRDIDVETRVLVEEFLRQSTSDLVRTLDALALRPDVDETRMAYLGVGLGAVVGTCLLGHDARPNAAVLAPAACSAIAADLDPATHLGGEGRCPLLIVATKGDASQALFEAAPEPRELIHIPGDATTMPEEGRERLWSFVRGPLGL